jgi:hypothetical protein
LFANYSGDVFGGNRSTNMPSQFLRSRALPSIADSAQHRHRSHGSRRARVLPSSATTVNPDDSADITDFVAVTPNGVAVTCASDRWALIVEKHPDLAGESESVREAVEDPDEIRQSRRASNTWLCYRRRESRFLCAVIAIQTGMLLTAYRTNAMKVGEIIWTRSE